MPGLRERYSGALIGHFFVAYRGRVYKAGVHWLAAGYFR